MQDVHQIEAFRTPDHVELTEFMAIDLDLLQNCERGADKDLRISSAVGRIVVLF